MSLAGLVAYDTSDDSDEEVSSEEQTEQAKSTNTVAEHNGDNSKGNSTDNTAEKTEITTNGIQGTSSTSLFTTLPTPIGIQEDLVEDDDIPVVKASQMTITETQKKKKAPVKISFPSLSEFKDVDEEMQEKKPKIKPSATGCGLLSALPPPSGSLKASTSLIPKVLTAKTSLTPTQVKKPPQKPPQKPIQKSSALSSIKYDSNSEDEDEVRPSTSQKSIDFFSLDESQKITVSQEAMRAHMLPEKHLARKPVVSEQQPNESQRLMSTVMELPREEILMKNQAEVGPKLPVPEQEYRVDADGNVAFDEKAIEYLVGKRGVKRKKDFMQEANIIDIHGDDIKPDEREWLVKALTEEPVHRPVSLGAGPSGASKKKHQITYLAHQAKAMEVELQNQWASNRVARNQTKSKYGF